MSFIRTELLISRIAGHAPFRERASMRGTCKNYRAAIDRDVALELLESIIEDICSTEVCPQNDTWETPCRRRVLHGAFSDEDLDEWLSGAIPCGRFLLRLAADTLSRILTFKYEPRADDVGDCPCTVEAMPVLTTLVEVDRFWDNLFTTTPAALKENLATAQWLMRILVRRYNFTSLRAVVWCNVWREGMHPGLELVQLFFEDKLS
mmetsp:Transcript_67600/g.197850  ORF Transcript_67600/g.197850 Transcript_67600/m.197850 type:complete len:206 (-) Transcript_67600:39-656(-)